MALDSSILELFVAQHGVASITQLTELGTNDRTVRRWLAAGLVSRFIPRVVALPGVADTFETQSMALQLQLEPDGYLSGLTAARHYGIRSMPLRRVFATTTSRSRFNHPSWARVSRTNWRDEDLMVLRSGFKLEEPHSMLMTIAASGPDYRLERAAEDAWNLELVTPESVKEFLDARRRRGRSGVTRLERWVGRAELRSRPMQSGFEVDMLTAIRRAHLPEPEKQHPLVIAGGIEIHFDLAWPGVKLALEPGHSLFHAGKHQVARDTSRDRSCAALGWQVLRFSEDTRRDLNLIAREVATVYAHRASLIRAG